MIGKIVLAAALAYFLGSIPFGYLLYWLQQGRDIRSTGSGNIGATNVLRTAGSAAGAATLILDAAKGFLAVMLAAQTASDWPHAASLGAVLAVLGHIYPVFLGFRGGKGVATALGAFLPLAPFAVLIALLIFFLVAAAWRYVSLASIAAAAAFPWTVLALDKPASSDTVAAAVVCAVLIIARHRSNMQRLRAGTEKRIVL